MDRLRQIILPVGDLGAAIDHYTSTLGLSVQFRDGERWAALDLGGMSLCLAGPGEQPAGAEVALGVKVAELDAAIVRLSRQGGTVVSGAYDGPHERRATIRDRFGTVLALYEPLTGTT
jgi:predicted enzyme related to lactoylglutathione lyase